MTAHEDPDLPLVRELSSMEVEEWLGRRHGWAKRHIVELGGYQDGRSFRFPVHAIKAYQERRAQDYAREHRIRRVS